MSHSILVVEDEGIVAKDIAHRLRSLGYAVTGLVPSAAKAFDAISLVKPDLVLMDIHLKGDMDGIAAASIIREQHDIPVIFLTAFADVPTLERAKLSEPFGYILKPFEERSLHVHIEMALVKHASECRLRQREQWITSVLHSVREAIVVTNLSGVVTFINASAQHLTGWSEAEALGSPIQFVLPFCGEARTHGPIEWVLRNMTSFVSENLQLDFGARGVLTVGCTAVPLYDHSQTVVGVTLGVRDVSSQRELERHVYESKRSFETALKSRTEALTAENEQLKHVSFSLKHRLARLEQLTKKYKQVIRQSRDAA